MTRIFSFLFCVTAGLLFLAEHAAAWEGVVVKVIDGDSLRVQRNGKTVELRLYGIDTPEYRQPYSNKAKQFARRFVDRHTVTVREKDIDRYGRIVALVESRAGMLNRELVRAGLAWYYPKYCREQPLCGELESLENDARKAGRGLWRDTEPVAPWEWKRQQKNSGSKGPDRWYYRLLDWL